MTLSQISRFPMIPQRPRTSLIKSTWRWTMHFQSQAQWGSSYSKSLGAPGFGDVFVNFTVPGGFNLCSSYFKEYSWTNFHSIRDDHYLGSIWGMIRTGFYSSGGDHQTCMLAPQETTQAIRDVNQSKCKGLGGWAELGTLLVVSLNMR